MQQGGKIGLFTSSVMWAVRFEDKFSTRHTRVQFRPLAVYHIFHKTDTLGVSFVSISEKGGALKKKFVKKIC